MVCDVCYGYWGSCSGTLFCRLFWRLPYMLFCLLLCVLEAVEGELRLLQLLE